MTGGVNVSNQRTKTITATGQHTNNSTLQASARSIHYLSISTSSAVALEGSTSTQPFLLQYLITSCFSHSFPLLLNNMTSLSSTPSSPSNTPLLVYNFPPVPFVYSVCPFAIKLESYLRINHIAHETIYTTKFSSKFSMPYCRFGGEAEGEEVSDSNVIIERLQKEHKVTDQELSPMDRAVIHTVIRMLEEHTAQIGFYYRYGLDMKAFVEKLEIADRWGQGQKFTNMWLGFQPDATKEKTKKRGLLRHDDEEIWKFSNDDLKALSDMLGDHAFFFGRDQPSLADCAVFGHLSQFLWIPIDFPQQKYLKEQCPNLVRFVEHFRSQYWPDWEECCQKKPNQKLVDQAAAEEKKE